MELIRTVIRSLRGVNDRGYEGKPRIQIFRRLISQNIGSSSQTQSGRRPGFEYVMSAGHT